MYRVDTAKLIYFMAYELKLFAPAYVNGEETLAYLDTAATQITVSSRVAKNSPRRGKKKFRSAFGEDEFDTVIVDVEFLGDKQRSVQARVHEGNSLLPFHSDVTLDGETLFKRPLIYDFRIMGLLLAEEVWMDDWVKVSSEFIERGLCMIEMEAYRKPVWTLFDTGAGLSVVNSERVHENGIVLEEGYEIEISDATGVKEVQEVRVCSGLRVGGMELPPFDSIVVDLGGIEEALDEQIDLVFGANVMMKSSFRWSFDREKNEVYVSR